MNSLVHAQNSAEKFGGVAADYLEIHTFLDSSKAAFGDSRHRAMTHNTWFISMVLPRVFGETRKNSVGVEYSVREVGEQHVLEDFDMLFIPTPQDWLGAISVSDWMDNARDGAVPPSRAALAEKPKRQPTQRSHFPDLHRGCGGENPAGEMVYD